MAGDGKGVYLMPQRPVAEAISVLERAGCTVRHAGKYGNRVLAVSTPGGIHVTILVVKAGCVERSDVTKLVAAVV